MKWKRITAERYHEMLEILPPAVWQGVGFLVGEAYTHRECRVSSVFRAAYSAFATLGNDQYFEADEPLTAPEFKSLTREDILQNQA